jgi:hypothetical protein
MFFVNITGSITLLGDCVLEGIIDCVLEGIVDCVLEGIIYCVLEGIIDCVLQGIIDCVLEGIIDCVLEGIIRPLVSVLPLTWFIGGLCSRGYHPPTSQCFTIDVVYWGTMF